MNKIFRNSVCLILCLVMMFSIFGISVSAEEEEITSAFTQEDMLHTKGRRIYNGKGDEIVLKGVNLGGWLIHEEWFCPVNGVDNETTMSVLAERFGMGAAYDLIHTYEDNWITEYDLEQIKELGFNCVRVPFWYRNFYYNDNGDRILNADGEWDFSRFDWIIDECEKLGLYVILDFHGMPGYQSNKDHSGKVNSASFFKLGARYEEYRKLAIELWTAIAERYSDSPAIAMYDLINEPNCDTMAYLMKNRGMTINVYDRMYDAIRGVGDSHIITMEAIWRLYNLPMPSLKGWTNVVYQLHLYDESNFMFNLLLFLAKLYPYGVPLYIGEFKPLGNATWESVMTSMTRKNYSWTVWTYKGFGGGASTSSWFICGSKNSGNGVDIYNDSYETIMEKWGECLRTENGNYSLTGLQDTLADYLN